jgi:hypothetical protein
VEAAEGITSFLQKLKNFLRKLEWIKGKKSYWLFFILKKDLFVKQNVGMASLFKAFFSLTFS